MITSAAIKGKAAELGFDLCGIAPADRFPELEFLDEWLARGYAGEMTYLSRSVERRADVRAVVPGARSVIVTGTLYNSGPEPREAPECAVIARYAWGDDYHDVLKKRLEALLAWMRAESPDPFEARAYVDTGPVQERVYAQYAGLGWIGKNTCLINAGLGSWLFLAEIICTLPLDPDAQGLEQCGTCRRCLDACPLGLEPDQVSIRLEVGRTLDTAIYGPLDCYECGSCSYVCPSGRPLMQFMQVAKSALRHAGELGIAR